MWVPGLQQHNAAVEHGERTEGATSVADKSRHGATTTKSIVVVTVDAGGVEETSVDCAESQLATRIM